MMTAHKRDDPISRWAHQLRENSGWQKAVVALANKNARILWAVFVRGKAFDARHVISKPQGNVVTAQAGRFAICLLARRESEDALNRSDRWRAIPTNPLWRWLR